MDELRQIAEQIDAFGGRAFLVGGSVRDMLLDVEPKDFDVEVFGMDIEVLMVILQRFGRIDAVGRSFGVIKLTTESHDFDFSMPRTDSKVGAGHTGFVIGDTQDQREASARRDFTINSMSIDILTGELVDFFGGETDLVLGILRATSEHFSEDALRVLRGFQFAGRFDLDVADFDTISMCQLARSEFDSLSIERVWGEWEKWARKSVRPSRGLRFLREVCWLTLFPELWDMVDLEQDPSWHPEGDTWTHILHSVDSAVEIAEREQMTADDRMTLVFSALCHDMGKATTTTFDSDGHVRSRAHDTAGVAPAQSFMERIGAPRWLVEKVEVLVAEHMFHVHNRAPSARAIRRLSVRVQPSTIKMLCFVMEADHSARPPLAKGMPEICERMTELAEQEQCKEQEVQPLVMGRDLIALGMSPGRHFGVILGALFKAQVAGVFVDKAGAMAWAREFV